MVLIALAAVPAILRYLVFWPMDQWQVDVEVYRDAVVSILTGRPIYSAMTEASQLLPFTYPPFASGIARIAANGGYVNGSPSRGA